MAKHIPLVGAFEGRVGALMYQRNRIVRQFVARPSTAPKGLKRSFGVLACAWRLGNPTWKDYISAAGVFNSAPSWLTRLCAVVYGLNSSRGIGIARDFDGILPVDCAMGWAGPLPSYTPTVTADSGKGNVQWILPDMGYSIAQPFGYRLVINLSRLLQCRPVHECTQGVVALVSTMVLRPPRRYQWNVKLPAAADGDPGDVILFFDAVFSVRRNITHYDMLFRNRGWYTL